MPIQSRIKTKDDLEREQIPSRDSLPTLYQPCGNLLMCIPLRTPEKIGSIVIPGMAQKPLSEGHIVEKGPLCSDNFAVGDCIVWDENSEYKMNVDGVRFVLVGEPNITLKIPVEKLKEHEGITIK